MLGIQHQRGVHGANMQVAGRFAVQDMQKMRGNTVIVSVHHNTAPEMAKWYQYSNILPNDAIKRSPKTRVASTGRLGHSGSNVPSMEQPVRRTSMGWALAGNLLQHVFERRGQVAQAFEVRLVSLELIAGGQFAVNEQIRHFLKAGVLGKV